MEQSPDLPQAGVDKDGWVRCPYHGCGKLIPPSRVPEFDEMDCIWCRRPIRLARSS